MHQPTLFRHKWIIIKWASTVYLIICGLAFLGPWSTELLETAQNLGIDAISDGGYILARFKLLNLLGAQVAILIILSSISVYNPWETREAIELLNRKLRLEE